MNPSLERKLGVLLERHQEVALLLAQPEVASDSNRFRDLSREYARLQPLADATAALARNRSALESARGMLADADFAAMAREEIETLEAERIQLEEDINIALLPRDERDDSNVFLEIRAGTGGDEAALFAGDLLRMYLRYAERRRWRVEILSDSAGEHGGHKEIIVRIEGDSVFSRLKFESGTHRVQRVPATESQGRIHTSAATVAILPEQDEVDEIEINPGDIKVDTFRASGAGGQHVNKTDSAIRITHLPSGMVVECQDERSQHKNRARALSLLKARLLDQERSRQVAAQSESRRLQVGSGDRSQRIRTYNFPQGRITDHRINLTLYRLDEVLEGDLDALVEPLLAEDRADRLASLASGC